MAKFVSFTYEVSLRAFRCWKCGTWWALEEHLGDSSTTCPRCLREENESLRKTVTGLGKTVSAMKGALTKANKRWRKAK